MTEAGEGTVRKGHAEFEYVEPGALETRASFALKALAIINGFGVVLAVVPPNPPVATLHTVAFNAASAVLVVIMIRTVLALDRDQPWAIATIRPLFALIGAAGVALVTIAVADGRIRLPFDVLLSAWVLLGRPHTRPLPPLVGRALAAVVAAAILLGVMLGSSWLFRWGGVIDVQPSQLETSLTADCTAHEAGAPLPETIDVAFDWRWSTWRPLPSGTDVVVIGWDGNDGAGKVAYFTGEIPDPPDGIHPGYRAYPSAAMAAEIMKETRNHWVWGIKMDEQGYEPGHVDVQLDLVNSAPGAEPLRIVATYIHEGAWRQDAAVVTCAW